MSLYIIPGLLDTMLSFIIPRAGLSASVKGNSN